MKITVNNLSTEYPKISATLPDSLGQEQFKKTVDTYLPHYGKSDTIDKRVNLFVDKLNEVLAKQKPTKAPAKTKSAPKSNEKRPQNLAELKRYIKKGMMFWHFFESPTGWSVINLGRPIVTIQNNAITFLHTDSEGKQKESWLYWPKASELKFTDDYFAIMNNAKDGYIMYYYYEDQAKNIKKITGGELPKSNNKAKKPTQNAKKVADKAKKPVTKKATPQSNKQKATQVENYPEDIRLIRRFYNCFGKEKQRRTIIAIYRDFERRIVERKVKKTSIYADLIREIQTKLQTIIKKMTAQQLTHIKLLSDDEAFFKKLKFAAEVYEVRTSVNLLKRVIGVVGEVNPDKAKVKRIHDAIEKALQGKKVGESDLYFNELKAAYSATTKYLNDNSIAVGLSASTLNGLGVSGLGKPKATTKKPCSGKKKTAKVDINKQFNADLDLYIQNKHKGTEFDLGKPGKLLQTKGLENLTIVLSKSILTKKIKKHGFKAEILKDLPKKLNAPVMLFNSKEKEKKPYGISKVIVVGGIVKGEGILTIIVTKDKYNRLIINKIDSIGGRNAKQIWFNIEDGNLQYDNKRKILQHLTEASIASDINNVQDFDTKIRDYFGFEKSNLKGIEDQPQEQIEVTRFQVDLTPQPQPIPQPSPGPVNGIDNEEEEEPTPAPPKAKSDLFTPITAQVEDSGLNKIQLPGDLGKFLGYVERYEYSILLRGEKGAGKSRLTYQLMNTFAKAGFTVGCFSLEIGKQSNIVKEMRNAYISPLVADKIQIADSAPNGLDDIYKAAELFDVVCIDSWGKIPGVKSDDFDKLRKAYPKTMFIVIFQSTTNGTARGGSMPEYDAGIVIQVAEGGKAYCEKNRYSGEDLTYLVFERRLAQEAA